MASEGPAGGASETGAPSGGGEAADLGPASSGSEFDARQVSETPEAVSAAVEQQQQRFKFGRREWPSQERAENEFLNTIGRLQAAQRQLQERDRELETLRTAVASRGGGEGKSDGGASGAAATVEEAAAQLLDPDSLDWEVITDAMRERGPEVGLYLFAQKLAGALGKGFDARMQSVTDQLAGYERGSRAWNQAHELWDGAVMAADDQGQLYFPELSDPANLKTAMAIWREITEGMPPEVAMHPRMARMAMLELRSMQQQQSGAATGEGNGSDSAGAPMLNPGQVAEAQVQRLATAAGSRGVLPPGRGTQPGRRPQPESEGDRIKRSLMTSGQEVGQLGFRR